MVHDQVKKLQLFRGTNTKVVFVKSDSMLKLHIYVMCVILQGTSSYLGSFCTV